jgi:hypothetical protein
MRDIIIHYRSSACLEEDTEPSEYIPQSLCQCLTALLADKMVSLFTCKVVVGVHVSIVLLCVPSRLFPVLNLRLYVDLTLDYDTGSGCIGQRLCATCI